MAIETTLGTELAQAFRMSALREIESHAAMAARLLAERVADLADCSHTSGGEQIATEDDAAAFEALRKALAYFTDTQRAIDYSALDQF